MEEVQELPRPKMVQNEREIKEDTSSDTASLADVPAALQMAQINILKTQAFQRFGRLDSDYHVITRIVRVEAQNTLSGMVYDQMQQRTTKDLPITRQNFIRMWKTIILKRVQDVTKRQCCIRPDHYFWIDRNILMPAPLADLIYQLGSFHSPANGIVYHIAQPAYAPSDSRKWWYIDMDILEQWTRTIRGNSATYVMREFPKPQDWNNKPIVVTSIKDDGIRRSIKSLTNDTQATDAFIRFVNDDLFEPTPGMAYDECHIQIVQGITRRTIMCSYVQSYVKSIV